MDRAKLLHNLKIDIRDLIIASLAVIGFVVFVSVFTYVYFARDLQSKESVMNRNDTGVVLLDRNNKPFFTFYQGHYANFVPLSEIPKVTQQAVVDEEDKDFYSHAGFSIKSIIGAAFADLRHQQLSYGGSTITQQLVKNVLLNSNKSFLRKYQELILAQELERRYSKDEILEMYLNSVYLGNGAFGVDEAAQTYFGKKAQDLDLAESALIAAILPAPTELSPIEGDANRALARQQFVLEKMYQDKFITKDQETQALSEKLDFKGESVIPYVAPHFALMVKQQLIDKYGEERVARSGFKVKTTLDIDWQNYAQEQVKLGVDRLKGNIVSNGAAVVMDPKTGEVKALVGSKDWNDPSFGKVNIAESPRQPGSSFKPIVYSSALEQRLITPATQLHDSPTTFNNCPGATPLQLQDPRCKYSPHDYDGKYRGIVTTRRALDNSLNIPSVEIMSKVGVPSALEMAKRLGISTLGNDPTSYGLSLVLGAGEVKLIDMVGVYGVFANGGNKVTPTLISEIDDKTGNVVYSYQPQSEEVLDPGVAYLISSILSDSHTRAEEFGNALDNNRNAAVKTGTTENYKDAWTMGYTPSLVVGVWVGNNDGTPMDQIAGSLGAAPIWKALIEHFLAGTPVESFQKPDDVVTSQSCFTLSPTPSPSASPTPLPSPTTISFQEYFLMGTEPKVSCRPISSPNPTPSSSPIVSTPPPQSPNPTPTPTSGVQGVSVQQSNTGGGGNTSIVNGSPNPSPSHSP